MTMFLHKRLKTIALTGLVAGALLTHPVHAEERILAHDIWLEAEKDRSVTITEIIQVDAENKKIGDGIVRYVDMDSVLGGKGRFRLLSALRDDAPTRAVVEEKGIVARIELGWPSLPAKKTGVTTFKLRYAVDEKINTAGTLDHIALDSLFGIWPVPMEKAKVRIIVPEGMAPTSWYARLDHKVTHGDDVVLEEIEPNKIAISLVHPLAARQMFGIGLAWPEGAIASPTLKDIALGWFDASPVMASIGASYAVLTLFILLAALLMERRASKEALESSGAISRSLSPAALRVFIKRHFDKRSFIALILSMAAKGHLTILDNADGIVLRRNSEADYIPDLSAEESAMDEGLFHSGSRREVKLDHFNHGVIEAACRDAEWILQEYTGPRFWRNSYGFFYLTVVLAVLGAGLVLHVAQPLNVAQYTIAGILAAFGLVFVICGNSVVEMYHAGRLTGWADAVKSRPHGTLALLVMMGSALFVGAYLNRFVGLNGAATLLGLFALTLGFHAFSHGPTAEGAALVEQGQVWRKAMARTRRLGKADTQTADDLLKLFERGMGPSYALGAEQAWRHAFREAFNRNDGYFPSWYRGYEFDPLKLEDRLYHQLVEAHVSL